MVKKKVELVDKNILTKDIDYTIIVYAVDKTRFMVDHEYPDLSLTNPISPHRAEREAKWRPAAGKKGMVTK